MRKNLSLISISLLAAFVGCAEMEQPQVRTESESATLTINVKSGSQSTKASTSYTDSQTYESKANSILVLVYDSAGNLVASQDMSGSSSCNMDVLTGSKTVVAVVNYTPAASKTQTLSDLESSFVYLSDNSTTATKGFVMYGRKNTTVSSSGTAVTVTVERLASRVALRSVTNGIAASNGSLTVKNVFVSNVVGSMCLGGAELSSIWYNKEGRKDESTRVESHKIDGTTYTASIPDMTYRNINQTVTNGATHSPTIPYLMYCYQNYSTKEPNGFSSTFVPQRTVLVVYAGYGGNYWYYPVVLNSGTIDPNTAYTVDLTITGPGSDDPNIPVLKGSLESTIDIAPWNPGDIYNETI